MINLPAEWIVNLASSLLFIILTGYIIWKKKEIAKHLPKVKRKTILLLTILVVAAIIVSAVFIPHHFKWFTDEPDALERGKRIIVAQEEPTRFIHPVGWSVELSYLFLMFGLSANNALFFNSILYGLGIIGVFLIGYWLTRKEEIGLFAGLIYASVPTILSYSGTAINNISSNFWLVFAIALIILSYRTKSKEIDILAIILIGIASIFRTENYFLFAYYLIGAFIFKKDKKAVLRLVQIGLLIFILTVPNLVNNMGLYLNNDLAAGNTGHGEQTWGLDNFERNKETFQGLVTGSLHPYLITITYLVGIIIGLWKRRKETLFLLAWMIPLLLAFTQYFHAPPRFLIGIYPIIAVFSAITINHVLEEIGINKRKKQRGFSRGFLTNLIVLLIIIIAVPGIKALADNPWPAHTLATYTPAYLEDNYEDCIIVAQHETSIRATTNLKTIKSSEFVRMQRQTEGQCYLYFEDMYCDGTFGHAEECQIIKKYYKAELIETFKEETDKTKNELKIYKLESWK